MIFAGIDVDLQGNERAEQAGPAMYLWTYVMLWMRQQKRDGFVPRSVALGCLWGGPIETRLKTNQKAARALQDAGLWLEAEGGWDVFNYRKKNDTKEVIEARIESHRQRQAEYQRRKRGASSSNAADASDDRQLTRHSPPTSQVSPGAGAGAGAGVSSAGSSLGVQGGPPVTDMLPPPPSPGLGFLGYEREWFQRGVREATGNTGYVAPAARDCGQLVEFIHAGAPRAGPAEAERWLVATVTAFVHATAGQRRFYPLDKTTGLAKWIAEGRPDASALAASSAGPRRDRLPMPRQQTPANAPWLPKE